MTVRQLSESMDAAEFAEWQAYHQLEPFGEPWKQTSYICTLIGNSAGGKGQGRAYKPEDFLPVAPPKRQQSPQEMLAIFRGLAAKNKKPPA